MKWTNVFEKRSRTFLCSIIGRKRALLRWGGGGALASYWFFQLPPFWWNVDCVEFLPTYVTPVILTSLLFSCCTCRMVGLCSICPALPPLIGRQSKKWLWHVPKLNRYSLSVPSWIPPPPPTHRANELVKYYNGSASKFSIISLTKRTQFCARRCTFLSYQLAFWKYKHFHESKNLRQNSFTNDLNKK